MLRACEIEIVMLGSGTSHGVPMIGCRCAVCTSDDPHDRRSRPSLFVRAGDVHLLIDTAPELRLQCVGQGIDRVDAVLFTHHHADHVAGLDDLRRFNWIMKQAVPLYGTERTLANVRRMFLYAFESEPGSPHSRPQLTLHTIDVRPFEIGGQIITPIPLMHGPMPVLGFRFGSFAYCTDCNLIPEESRLLLEDLDVLVLDALRRTPHPAHFNLDEAVEAARAIGAGKTYFTHITHQLGHEETNATLPDGMALGYDGLRIRVPF
ncbi:MAG: MBL fold metallo-hydrolase [Phycisphaerae bacterium]